MDSVTTYRNIKTGGVNPENILVQTWILLSEINQYIMRSVHNNINLQNVIG